MNRERVDRPRTFSTLESAILSLVLILANLRATMFVYLHPNVSVFWSPAWIEILSWLFLSVLAVNDMKRRDVLEEFAKRWQKNLFVAGFVLLALLSVLWSMSPVMTLFRALELFFATLLASYLGLRYSSEQVVDVLFWFGAVLLILSIAIVYSAPGTGVMDWAPYNGAWRGVYWNRNHLASIAALLNAVFLIRLIDAVFRRNPRGMLDGVFYLLSLITLYFTNSATGFILAIALHFFVFGAWLWTRLKNRLLTRHYLVMAGLLLVGVVILLTNLDFVFRLFNRSSTMTGRVQLWEAILENGVATRLWLGNGFGAAWSVESFRVEIMQKAGWAAQPLIGDNGYLEILLHLGALGLGLFFVLFITLLVRSLRHGIGRKTLTGFFPLLLVIYAMIANITFSLFAETEVFVWLLLVSALFMISPRRIG